MDSELTVPCRNGTGGASTRPVATMAIAVRRRIAPTLAGLVAVILASAGVSCVTAPRIPDGREDLAPDALVSAGLPKNWSLVWQDEFVGTAIRKHWSHEVDAEGGGNNELQYYTARAENSFVSGGRLRIVGRKEYFEGPQGARAFTSARLNTKGHAGWTYGRFEIRARLPEGRGIWPAIWMMPVESVYGGWAASGEIDIVELVGHTPGRVYGTLHYGGEWPMNTHTGDSLRLPAGRAFSDEFHVFTLIWEREEFHWFVDGVRYQIQRYWRTAGHEFPAPFDQAFYLILNLAVGGNWPGPPDESTAFPQVFEIDYVRVYQARR